jgi:hypothetical protein
MRHTISNNLWIKDIKHLTNQLKEGETMFRNSANNVKQRVRGFLESECVGEINAKTAAQSSYSLKISVRVFRAAVHELRAVDYMPILSSSSRGGYYLPSSPEEIAGGLEEFTGRIIALRAAAKGIKAGLALKFPNDIQGKLFDELGV